MTFRACDEPLSAISEDHGYSSKSGHFSQPTEEDYWCPTILDDPLTPISLDQMTDCPELSPDMSHVNMDQPFDDYVGVTSPEVGTLPIQPTEYPYQETYPNLDAMFPDGSTFGNAAQASVVLSPVLSHMSQNAHGVVYHPPVGPQLMSEALGSDPDVFSQWTNQDAYTTPVIIQDGFQYFPEEPRYGGFHNQVCIGPQSANFDPSQPAFCTPGCQVPEPRRAESENQVVPQRPLLPIRPAPGRVDAQLKPQHRAIMARPQQSSSNRKDSATTVSTAMMSAGAISAGTTMELPPTQILATSGELDPSYGHGMQRPERYSTAMSMTSTVSQQTFWTSAQYRQIDQSGLQPSSHAMVHGNKPTTGMPLINGDMPRTGVSYRSGSIMLGRTSSSAGDTDENRRSHEFYKVQPGPDGQYRCPFRERDENACKHVPTNLKCNYDKYIDSHIRPFRCKHDKCAEMQFSSTACLLRHEREAHGAHGHGKDPFMCHYAGCDRADEFRGRGFPRRYNLNDHMKRVHGWKEPDEAPCKATGRKRKVVTPSNNDAISRRQRV